VKGGSFATPPIPMYGRMEELLAEDCWFVYPQSQRPASNTPARPGTGERYYVGEPITANMRTLYIGFRTVKRK
jgi:hypothetical protein